MVGKIAEKLRDKKKLWMVAAGAVLIAVIALILLFVVFPNGEWTEGGTDTKGQFRYRLRHNGSLEVRVNTANFLNGTLVVDTDADTVLVTRDKGNRGKERVYYISGNDVSFENWSLTWYEGEESEENERYVLAMSIGQDSEGSLCVLAIHAQDVAPVQHAILGEYDCKYQIQERGDVSVQIYAPMQIHWYAQYDDTLLYVMDFFYEEEYADTSVMCIAEGEFETELCFYTLKDTTSDEEIRMDEIFLKVKGKDGVITEVTYE